MAFCGGRARSCAFVRVVAGAPACSTLPPPPPRPPRPPAPGVAPAPAVIVKLLSSGCAPAAPPPNPPRPPPPPRPPRPPPAAPAAAPSTGYASPPSFMLIAHVVPRLPGRVEVKNSVLPSSDQRGAVLSNAGAVIRRDGPPASD